MTTPSHEPRWDLLGGRHVALGDELEAARVRRLLHLGKRLRDGNERGELRAYVRGVCVCARVTTYAYSACVSKDNGDNGRER